MPFPNDAVDDVSRRSAVRGVIDYSSRQYWNERYVSEENKEWLVDYSILKPLLKSHLKPDDRILVLGCGNSSFTADLYLDGYSKITSVDFAEEVIQKMATKWNHCQTLRWCCADIRELQFDDSSFDVVIEKATIDALVQQSWELSDQERASVDAVCRQVSRVLVQHGVFMSISFAQPHFRLPLYAEAQYGWSVEVSSFGQNFALFLFAMVKGGSVNTAQLDRLLYPLRYCQKLLSDSSSMNTVVTCLDEDTEDFLLQISL